MKQSSRSFWGQLCLLLFVLTLLPILSIAHTYAGPAVFAEQSHREFVHMQLAWLTIPASFAITGIYLILTQKRKT